MLSKRRRESFGAQPVTAYEGGNEALPGSEMRSWRCVHMLIVRPGLVVSQRKTDEPPLGDDPEQVADACQGLITKRARVGPGCFAISSPCSDICPAQCGDAFPLVDSVPTIQQLADEMIARGVRRVHVLAWRDLDDPDAGGSEVHADEFMRRWAAAGLEITHRTSAAAGQPAVATRNGYRVIRRGSRYSVFPRAVGSEWIRHMGRYDALVEVWNGVPWMSPLWCRRPHITFLHHVHGPMWDRFANR